MNDSEFIAYWELKKNAVGNGRAVGIGVNWRNIRPETKVSQFYGTEAWTKIGDFYTPLWGGFRRTKLKEWLNTKRPDYQKFIDEEKTKIEFYKRFGLPEGYREFCAFANLDGTIGVLGDGNHRYIDCNYLIASGRNFDKDIKECRLDILCSPNLHEIIGRSDWPPELGNQSQ